jgi:hypothetical protein
VRLGGDDGSRRVTHARRVRARTRKFPRGVSALSSALTRLASGGCARAFAGGKRWKGVIVWEFSDLWRARRRRAAATSELKRATSPSIEKMLREYIRNIGVELSHCLPAQLENGRSSRAGKAVFAFYYYPKELQSSGSLSNIRPRFLRGAPRRFYIVS